jgi:predicted nucleic acid-binding protein
VQLAVGRIADVTLAVHVLGLHLAERYGLSVYDSMIAAAAMEARCTTLWSEDMQHGMVLAGRLTIRNPFT